MEKWEYMIDFRTPFGIYSGMAVAWLVDRMVVRDKSKLPYIPGSSIKGRWRFSAERLLRSSSIHDEDRILYRHADDAPGCKDRDTACTICRLFGNQSLPSTVWVGNAKLKSDWQTLFKDLHERSKNSIVFPDADIKPGIAISRALRTALTDHLFFEETIPPVSFEGTIIVNTAPGKSLSEKEIDFLHLSAEMVRRLGGKKSIGRGAITSGIILIGGANEKSRLRNQVT